MKLLFLLATLLLIVGCRPIGCDVYQEMKLPINLSNEEKINFTNIMLEEMKILTPDFNYNMSWEGDTLIACGKYNEGVAS